MAHQTGDRVRETTTTTGTGTLTLAGAATGFRAFSAVCANNDTALYCAADQSGANWEVGIGTWTTGNLLVRTAGGVLAGSAGAGVLVTFAAGTKDVFITAPATKLLQQDANGNVRLPAATVFPASVAGEANLFIKSIGGRLMLGSVGPSGLDSVYQPHMGRNRTFSWKPIGNATTVPVVDGIAAPTALGTATARNVATTNILTRAKRLGYVSAATAAAFAGHFFVAGAQQFTIGNGAGLGSLHVVHRFGVSDAAAVTGARQFVGWRNVVTTPTNVEPNTITNCFGLAQLSTDATQWYMVYGGSAAQTAIALGTTLGAPTDVTTLWDVSFFANPSANNSVGYTVTNLGTGVSVSGTLTGTAGTALPLSTALLAPIAWRCNNATLLAVGLDISSHYGKPDQ